jgi:type III secretory pathway component EscV
MSAQGSTGRTRVLLSFSSAYAYLARRLAGDLGAANIEVGYDQWEGGGGVSAKQSVSNSVNDVSFVLPILTPSGAAATWIGDEWRRAIYDDARARGVGILPVRGEGDREPPDFLHHLSFADLGRGDYSLEFRRLVETIRKQSGDARIVLPVEGAEAQDVQSPMTLSAAPLALEVPKELAPLFEGDEGVNPFVDEMVSMMREGLFYELGVEFPGLQLRPGSDLPPSSVRFVINDVPECEVEVRPDSVVVSNSVDAMAELGVAAEPVVNPANGRACAWIPASKAAAAEDRGLTTWDPRGFVILSLSAVLRRKAADFIGIHEARAMMDRIEPVFPQLVAETVPKTVSMFVLTDVLRRLVAEQLSIRDLRRILMALVDWGRVENDPGRLTEYVRAALKRQITHKLTGGQKVIVVFLLHPDIESSIRNSTRHTMTGSYVDLEPEPVRKILDAIHQPLGALRPNLRVPVILTIMEVRASVRRLVALSNPWLDVVSYQDLREDTSIEPVGRMSLDGFDRRDAVTDDGISVWLPTPER